MGKKVLVVVESQPFTTLNYYEALRVAAGLWNHEVKVLWTGQGVVSALKKSDKTLTATFLSDLPDLDVELYVEEEAAQRLGASEGELLEGVVLADRGKVAELLEEAEVCLVF